MKLKLEKSLALQSFDSKINFLIKIRSVPAHTFSFLDILRENPPIHFNGFLVAWKGEFIEGYCVCLLKQQTIISVENDAIADRFKMIYFYLIFPYESVPVPMY